MFDNQSGKLMSFISYSEFGKSSNQEKNFVKHLLIKKMDKINIVKVKDRLMRLPAIC